MNKIKAVIFDAGGVLHQSNSAAVEDLSQELGLSREVLAEIWQEQIDRLGLGEIDESEFWRQIRDKYGSRHVGASENLLGRAFADNLVPFEEILSVVRTLNEIGIKTAVLSNTIEPHARAVRQAGLYDNFDIIMLSHEIGLRKPHRKAYQHALKTVGVTASQTVFIDDSPENVQAAASVGIHGIVYTNPGQLIDELSNLIPMPALNKQDA